MFVHFIDTSVLLNIIDVPGRNQQRKEVMEELKSLTEKKDINALLELKVLDKSAIVLNEICFSGQSQRVSS